MKSTRSRLVLNPFRPGGPSFKSQTVTPKQTGAKKWFYRMRPLSMFGFASILSVTGIPAQVDIGHVEISSITHSFRGDHELLMNSVSDALINQRQYSSGGGLLP